MLQVGFTQLPLYDYLMHGNFYQYAVCSTCSVPPLMMVLPLQDTDDKYKCMHIPHPLVKTLHY